MTTIFLLPTFLGVSLEVYLILIILGIPIFYFYRWLFRRIIKRDKPRIIATWLATIFGTPVIYFCLVFLLLVIMNYYPNREFDQKKWLADKEKRYELSHDIIKSEILLGKTKTEVLQLLGDEENSYESDYWHYYLGFRPQLIMIDPEILDIEFEDGKVIRVGQHES